MKKQIKQIALRIMLIQEEFPESEILEAVKLLKESGMSSPLLTYLSKGKAKGNKSNKGRKDTSLDIQFSKAVAELREKNPEKFQVLSEFESSIRKGTVLKELSDIRRLGEGLSKNFGQVKSRKEAIGKLMTYIAELSLEEIRNIIQKSLSSKQAGEDSEFQQLAQFIITGKK